MRDNSPARFARSSARTGRRRGFTIIEIMVVVGIIVILAAIGIAVGVQVKRSARERATKTTLTTLGLAMGKYLHDGNAEPPINLNDGNTPSVWQPVLSATESTALSSLPHDTSGNIVDGYGKPIQYIPSNYKWNGTSGPFTPSAGIPGHFFSYGPDGLSDLTNPGVNDDIVSDGVAP